MTIKTLRITDFRNLSSIELFPCSRGLNIIFGDNGSGKTSLLEAIYYLGLGRSFRTSLASKLIKQSTFKFSLVAQLLTEANYSLNIGVERDIKGISRLRIAEKDAASIADIARHLPILVMNSQSHQLLEAGPQFRRKYLDWGLFYQTEGFLVCWRHFERALKQRNTLLRLKRPKNEIEVWSIELVKYGAELDRMRRAYIADLLPFLNEAVSHLLSFPHFNIQYQKGWEGEDYTAALRASLDDDYRQGYTQTGPHRADLEVLFDTLSVKHFLSRGQQKLLICAMILAQGMLLARQANKGLIYLVDDLPSELDLQSKQKLISLLAKQKAQIFITAIDDDMCNCSDEQGVTMKLFHVEHGSVTSQVY